MMGARSWLSSLGAALAFLTRLPVPLSGDGAGNDETGARDLGRSVVWFPAVGALLGGALWVAARALHGHLSPGLTAVALVALLAALTGGLHLDGLADTFDAWGGGRGERARMLEIMRDSRIGAHGAAALGLLLIAKVLAVGDLLARGALWPLVAGSMAARWAVVPLIVLFPYARSSGLGTLFHAQRRATDIVLATAIAAPAALLWGAPALRAGAMALVAALALSLALSRRLGGLTGDVYGAAIEIAELVFWASAP
jgi:adenosylcobinamide-GDP ribazoletransferase